MADVQSHPPVFSRARFAAVVLAGAYPVITALLYLVMPLTAGWAIWQRTLIVAPAMVFIMIYLLIPTVQKRLRRIFMVAAR